ncbi:hypothetical protein AB0H12_44265 [Actinosynnema sp. NPDC023794]
MHEFRSFLGAVATALALVAAPESSATAAPATPAVDVQVSAAAASGGSAAIEMVDVQESVVTTYTTTTAWVRQCASLSCGYHPIPANSFIMAYCYTSNVGIFWNMVLTTHPTNPNLPIAGFVDTTALYQDNVHQPCASVGTGPNRPAAEMWAHSCPLMACGYGVIQAGHDLALLAVTDQMYEGEYWALVLDHDNVNKDLVGFVHEDDLFF